MGAVVGEKPFCYFQAASRQIFPHCPDLKHSKRAREEIIFILNYCVCLCVGVCRGVHVCAGAHKDQKKVLSPGVTNGCELPDIGAGGRTRIL